MKLARPIPRVFRVLLREPKRKCDLTVADWLEYHERKEQASQRHVHRKRIPF